VLKVSIYDTVEKVLAGTHIRIDILNSIAVGCDVLIAVCPVPVVASNILQQVIVRTRWDAIERVVRAHHAANFGVSGALLEGWEVILRQVLGILGIEVSLTLSFDLISRCDTYDYGIVSKSVVDDRARIAVLFEVVRYEMLTTRDDLLDGRVDATLQALQQVLCVLARAEHVLTGSLLSASPFNNLSASRPESCAAETTHSADLDSH